MEVEEEEEDEVDSCPAPQNTAKKVSATTYYL
jgi:hypothetical protein